MFATKFIINIKNNLVLVIKQNFKVMINLNNNVIILV